MKRIFAMRHGEYTRSQDDQEFLTGEGIQTIHQNSEKIIPNTAADKVVIIVSPTERCIKTKNIVKEILGERNIAVKEEERRELAQTIPEQLNLENYDGLNILVIGHYNTPKFLGVNSTIPIPGIVGEIKEGEITPL